jgi:hypothetical protein
MVPVNMLAQKGVNALIVVALACDRLRVSGRRVFTYITMPHDQGSGQLLKI